METKINHTFTLELTKEEFMDLRGLVFGINSKIDVDTLPDNMRDIFHTLNVNLECMFDEYDR